jgi:eukaryotic-like serine/threonine-protein kinase
MTPERWQQIEQLYFRALEQTAEGRTAFLAAACAGDADLRQEVEELLAADAQAEGFIETPPADLAAGVIAQEPTSSATDAVVGQQIGHYQVLSLLGRGGMGEVYLAQDTRLRRKIALKLLPAQYTQDPARVRRFQREALAASALSHPNIIAIYEIGQSDETHFIATEYVAGQTLRQRLSSGRVELPAALDIAAQIGGALAVAHEAGIIHRDIKPENVMLRPDGLVKVLDFGLAKLAEQEAPDTSETSTLASETNSGIVLGTLRYMSPEQARGQKVDSRSDIFSLGVVLYEMLSGQSPFAGATTADVIAAILDREPPPLSSYLPAVPEKLERIIRQALRKEREQRYQTVQELCVELKDLRQELEFAERLGRNSQPESLRGEAGNNGQVRQEPARTQVAQPSEGVSGQTVSSAALLLSELKRHKRGALVTLAVCLLAVSGIVFALYRFFRQQPASPFQTIKVTRLTNIGKAARAAISPDGKYATYVIADQGQQGLWLGHIPTSSHTQIVPSAEVDYQSLVFSRDSNYVYYARAGAIYRLPVLGGSPKKLVEEATGYFDLSPDGLRLAFVREYAGQAEQALIVASADGTGERRLATRKLPDTLRWLAWSPDGEVIVCEAETGNVRRPTFGQNRNPSVTVIEVRLKDGTERTLTTQKWIDLGKMAWLPDGSGLLMTVLERAQGLTQIWHLSHPSGEARRITTDLNEYRDVSLTTDSKSLVTIHEEKISSVWIAPAAEPSQAKPVVSGKENLFGVRWLPDGRLLYPSNASGNREIWVMDADGNNRQQLTAQAGLNIQPAVSADGRYIAFSSNRTGAYHIWAMSLDGSNQRQLTNGNSEYAPSCSPDGNWVVYEATGDQTTLWKVPTGGGPPVQLTDRLSYQPYVSPDGKLIACRYVAEPGTPAKIALIPFAGGPPIKIFEVLPNTSDYSRWTADGQALTYVRTIKGVSNMWRQPITGSAPTQVTDFKSDTIRFFDWSREGQQVVYARFSSITDVVLINDLK